VTLHIDNIHTSYGHVKVLHGVSLKIGEGQIVTLLGRNGMGKTTTIRSIMGLTTTAQGEITFRGTALAGKTPYSIARLGIGLVPEGRRIFPTLTVEENLLLAQRSLPDASPSKVWKLEDCYRLFPRLRERRNNWGDHLSGGEQQMLAIARAMMLNPSLLILDEATEGLAPIIRQEVWKGIKSICSRGISALVVDKHLSDLMAIASYNYILENGRVVFDGTTEALQADLAVQSRYLGV
jgi:branched-chain amino acid transport system ATP-binding protein